MNTRIIIMTLVGSSLLLASGCDPDLSPGDQASAENAYKEAVAAKIGEQIDDLWGDDAPPDACGGEVICRGADENLEPLVCHECEELCKGSGTKDSWQSADPLNCPQQSDSVTFTIKFSVTLLQLGSASASAGTKMDIYSTATEKVTLGDPIAGAVGENPDSWTNWISVYSADFKSEGEIKVGFVDAAGDAVNVTIETAYSDSITGIRRCRNIDGGQVCGGDVGVPPHGGGNPGDGGADHVPPVDDTNDADVPTAPDQGDAEPG